MARVKYIGPVVTTKMQEALPAPSITRLALEQNQNPRREIQPILGQRQAHLLKQQQSQEMAQIMLHVSLGTLFYLREFLPLPCFGERDLKLVHRDSSISYRKFVGSNRLQDETDISTESPFGQGRRGQPLKILIRGHDSKADTILDLLEHGIFDALKKNFLEALQLTVIVDKDAPDNVLESYTFSFKYNGGLGEFDNTLTSVSLNTTDCAADMKTLQTARLGLEMIVRRLITLSSFLPILPNKRFLEIHLFYTENCPPEYEPPGFSTAVSGSIYFPLDSNWRRESQLCGVMDSGYHTVGLKVTSLKWTGPDPEGSESQPKIPADDVRYIDPIDRVEEIGFLQDCTATKKSSGNLDNTSNSQKLVQVHQDEIARQKLQGMLTMETLTPDPDLVPTQVLGVNALIETQGNEIRTHQIQFSRSKEEEIRIERNMNHGNRGKGIVQCQCGWNGEEQPMIECQFCYTRQHLLCYGVLNPNDSRLPDVHACYSCLLEPDEAHLLRELNTLVLLRRALMIIMKEGYTNKVSQFSQKLHCNGDAVIQVTNLLWKQGFLLATPGSKSKGFLEKGLPKFTIPESDAIRERIQEEIFNPMVKIEHHYTRIKKPTNVSRNVALDNSDLAQNVTAVAGVTSTLASRGVTGKNLADIAGVCAQQSTLREGVPESRSQSVLNHDSIHKNDEDETEILGNELANRIASRGRKRRLGPGESQKLLDASQVNQDSTAAQLEKPSDDIKIAWGRPIKQRKMSNAKHPLDVGATTDEGSP